MLSVPTHAHNSSTGRQDDSRFKGLVEFLDTHINRRESKMHIKDEMCFLGKSRGVLTVTTRVCEGSPKM